MNEQPQSASIVETHMEVRIAASTLQVWSALTEDIGAWWPDSFYAGGESGKRQYHLEAEPGGRMYEGWDGGGGVLWGTVVTVEPGRQLQITGTTFPNWGGPAVWFGTWTLEADGDGTVLTFSESTIGRITAHSTEQKEKGWRFLLGAALKSCAEGQPAPEWGADS